MAAVPDFTRRGPNTFARRGPGTVVGLWVPGESTEAAR